MISSQLLCNMYSVHCTLLDNIDNTVHTMCILIHLFHIISRFTQNVHLRFPFRFFFFKFY